MCKESGSGARCKDKLIMTANYKQIIADCEDFLEKYGDTHKGVGWLKDQDVDHRYRVVLESIKPEHHPCSILDYGCGLAHLYQYMNENGISDIHYTGLDASEKYLDFCRGKFPDVEFIYGDIFDENLSLPSYDYVILNGIFSSKRSLTQSEMMDYMTRLLKEIWKYAKHGIAFNVHSKQVDWERDDLFHLPMDELAQMVCKELSRHFVVRHDYGTYEYTTYVYKERQ